ncbi:hypothetical protein H8M03_02150 [Sphingomonas sabuli]|uniref:Uncharacterized protein n=1 Tax=Sphingomonas sabuli TaxID=2764186 RepID=A0A7G9L3I1_9SPHN|nr:hypothetical protein [Sphingomonas sabuli]QNM83180.1 hypothetical protein H8M03_02150 [Sphingomonas sabuli]
MMTARSAANPPKYRKLILQLVSGMIVGALAGYFVFAWLDGQGTMFEDGSRAFAIGVGLVYSLMGLVVALGLIAPGPGAHLLNVEDATEIVEQRGILWPSAIASLLIGLALLVLGVGGEGAMIEPIPAFLLAAVGLGGATAITVATRDRNDEMMRAVSRDSSVLSLTLGGILLSLWGGLAHLGLASWIEPLGLVAGIYALLFFSVLLVAGRRGLLMPR